MDYDYYRSEAVEQSSVLRTKAMREKDELKTAVKYYRFILLRIRFPEDIILQGGCGHESFMFMTCTVEPLNKGHVETCLFVLCREVVLSLEVGNVLVLWESENLGPKEVSFIERLFLLCPLFGGFTIGGSIVCCTTYMYLHVHVLLEIVQWNFSIVNIIGTACSAMIEYMYVSVLISGVVLYP